VRRHLAERNETKADLARNWGTNQAQAGRVINEGAGVSTDLGNLDAIAAALDLEITDLLFPMLRLRDWDDAALKQSDRAAGKMVRAFNRDAERYLGGLDRVQARRLLKLITLVPDSDLKVIVDIVEAYLQMKKGGG
jgi:DNA-binding Xre family transcriptional regulator